VLDGMLSVVGGWLLQLRRFRTMSELLLDAKQWAKHPWNAFGKKVVSIQIQIQFYWACSQKAKNQKAKQTIIHTVQQNNTTQDKKW